MSIFLLIALFCAPNHSFHVSVTDLKYNTTVRSLEITQRIFLDDLEKAIQADDEKFLIDGPESSVDAALSKYLPEKTKFKINGKKVSLSFIGHKLEDDVLIAFMEVEKAGKIKDLRVECSLFLDIYRDQTNILHFTKGEDKKETRSFKFDRRKQEEILISRNSK